MAFPVKNTRQALDALAYYAVKDAHRICSAIREKPSKEHLTSRAYRIVQDNVNGTESFNAALDRHADKFVNK